LNYEPSWEKYKKKTKKARTHSVGPDKSTTHLAAAKWENRKVEHGKSEAANGRARIVTHIF